LDLKEIKELIALMRKNDLSVFKMEKEGFKITLKKGDLQPIITTTAGTAPIVMAAAPTGATPAAATAPAGDAPAAAAPKEDANLREIKAPTIGTFYCSPQPDAAPYVSVGQEVAEDTVVGIMEAMKVMNEIKAETRGVIVEVVAENGKPVEYGQVLFRVR
jgi:acetyl-CoA carboxylase biotin carboxyl carrier protein